VGNKSKFKRDSSKDIFNVLIIDSGNPSTVMRGETIKYSEKKEIPIVYKKG